MRKLVNSRSVAFTLLTVVIGLALLPLALAGAGCAGQPSGRAKARIERSLEQEVWSWDGYAPHRTAGEPERGVEMDIGPTVLACLQLAFKGNPKPTPAEQTIAIARCLPERGLYATPEVTMPGRRLYQGQGPF